MHFNRTTKARLVSRFLPFALLAAAGCGGRSSLEALAPLAVDDPDSGSAAGPAACTGLCAQQARCGGGVSTTLTGTAYLPNGKDPLYNALVYIPSTALSPMPTGATCEVCGAPASGTPLVRARTAADGRFVLSNVPAGANIPIVVQAGKWRRQTAVPQVTACTENAVDPALTRLPRNQAEGDLPLMAVVTGDADALECALRDAGVDDAEFTGQGGPGRVQLFVDNGAAVSGALDQSLLPSVLMQYDAVFYDCDGQVPTGPATGAQHFIDFANAGGRVYMSHFDFGFLESTPWSTTARFADPPEDGPLDPATGTVDTTTADGQALAGWLGSLNALSGAASIVVQEPKRDVLAALPPARSWLATSATSTVGASTQLYSFDTPLTGTGAQCGGVVFASYHVSGEVLEGTFFPSECVAQPATPQEKAFEFLVFDVPTCAP
jgi:hypothetical protein